MSSRSNYEGRVIGAILRNPHQLPKVLSAMGDTGGNFSNPLYQDIFKEMVSIYSGAGTVDVVLLAESTLDADAQLVLQEIVEKFTTSLSEDKLDAYLTEIVRRTKLERVAQFADELKAEAKVLDTDLDDLIGKAHTRMFQIIGDASFKKIKKDQVIEEMFEETRTFKGKHLLGADTGWETVNAFTRGIRKKELWVVGAYTSVGKSWFCVHLASELIKFGTKVLYISTEMSEKRLFWRLTSMLLGLSEYNMIYGNITPEEVIKRDSTLSNLMHLPIEVKSGFANITEVISEIQEAKAQNACDIVIVDFLQNLAGGKDEYQEITIAIRKLQVLAQREDIGIVVASQTNRESVKDDWQMLMGFKGSGAIEAAADIAIILSRDKEDPQHKIVCDIRKNRNGMAGRISMTIDFSKGVMHDDGEWQQPDLRV